MRIKYLLIGLISGVLIATAGTAAAQAVIEKITASVRTDYSVQLDGKKVELKNAPLAYNGASYLPVREVAELVGKEVDFDNGIIKLETPKAETPKEDETVNSETTLTSAALDGRTLVDLLGEKYPELPVGELYLAEDGRLKFKDKTYQLQKNENGLYDVTPLLEDKVLVEEDLQ